MERIHYLDNAATTPVRPEAAQAAVQAMTEGWGNPSARYALGQQAAADVKTWRADLASALGCPPPRRSGRCWMNMSSDRRPPR